VSGPEPAAAAALPEAARRRAFTGLQPVDFALLGVTLVWGVNNIAVKSALARFSPLSFNVLRFAVASVLIMLVLRAAEGPLRLPPREDLPTLALVGFLGNTVYQVAFITGLARSTAGNVSFVLATMPATTAFLGHILRIERLSWRTWAGVGTTLGGAILIVISGSGVISFGGASTRGDLIVLAGTVGWCMYTLMSKGLLRRYTPLRLTAWTMVIGAAMLAPFGLPELVRQDWSLPGPAEWGALVGSASLALVAGYVIWGWGLSRIGTARTAMYGNITPLWTGLLGWLLMGERWGAWRIVGAALILLGVAVVRAGQAAASARENAGYAAQGRPGEGDLP